MLLSVPVDETEKWDGIVSSFKDHDVYYLNEYVRAFRIHGDGEPLLIYIEANGARAMNVVMRRDISLDHRFAGRLEPGRYFDFATPYGYGGFIVDGHDVDVLDAVYTAYCRGQGVVAEFARFHPVLNNRERVSGMYDIRDIGKTVCMDLRSHEVIWDSLTSKNRNMIRKGQRAGVQVFWGRSPELFDRFKALYKATMDRDGADPYYYFGEPFFDSVLYDLRHNSMIFYAKWNGEIISMCIILFANRQMHYHLSALDRQYQQLASTNLLLYEAACWGCKQGYRTLHLGGGVGGQEDSLYRFKKAFARDSSMVFSIGRKCFDPNVYDRLVSIRAEDSAFNRESLFFPLYRA